MRFSLIQSVEEEKMNCHYGVVIEQSVNALVPSSETVEEPELLQKIKHEGSVLSLAISDEYIFAGTQRKNILVRPSQLRPLIE